MDDNPDGLGLDETHHPTRSTSNVMGDDQWAMTEEEAPAAEREPEGSSSAAAAPADEVAAMLMRMSAPVEWEHALAHDRSKASSSSPSGSSGNNNAPWSSAPVHNNNKSLLRSPSRTSQEGAFEPSELSGIDDGASSLMGAKDASKDSSDAFALLAGMDVEMDLLTMEAPRGAVLPLLDFSKLKGYESPPRGGGGSGGGGGGGATAEKGLSSSAMLPNAHHAFAGPGPSPRSALESSSSRGHPGAPPNAPAPPLPPRADGIGRGRPVLPTTPRKGNHHVTSTPRKPSMLCCFG